MENIPAGYFIFVYVMMALPFVMAVAGVIAAIIIARLYFTNRRSKALKILKVSSAILLPIIILMLLMQASLGIL